jgi:hypothetical protein
VAEGMTRTYTKGVINSVKRAMIKSFMRAMWLVSSAIPEGTTGQKDMERNIAIVATKASTTH